MQNTAQNRNDGQSEENEINITINGQHNLLLIDSSKNLMDAVREFIGAKMNTSAGFPASM